MSDKEKIKTLHWLVAFLIVALIAAGVYIVNNELKEDTTNTTEMEKQSESNSEERNESLEQPTEYSETVNKLFNIFREDGPSCRSNENLDSSTEEKIKFAAGECLKESSLKIKYGNLDQSIVDEYISGYLICNPSETKEAVKEAIKNEKVRAFSLIALKEKYEELFGINTIEDLDKTIYLDDFGSVAYYDENKKIYAELYDNVCGGGDCESDSKQTIDNVYQDDKKLIIYTTLKGTYENKTINYTFELEKETGNYIFVSRESK